MWGADWKICYGGNCSASWGLTNWDWNTAMSFYYPDLISWSDDLVFFFFFFFFFFFYISSSFLAPFLVYCMAYNHFGLAMWKHVFRHMRTRLIRALAVRWQDHWIVQNGEQMPGWNLVHVQYDLNLCILRMFKGTFFTWWSHLAWHTLSPEQKLKHCNIILWSWAIFHGLMTL